LADLVGALQETLGISFHDLSLLEQAVVHSSYLNENPNYSPFSNERLEFLGDAILDFVIAEKLYQAFPGLTEGEMTKLRSVLVRQDTLARVARTIRLGHYLYLGKGEERSGGRHKSANQAGALEAVIAAVFLDRDLTITRELILRLFADELQRAIGRGTEVDYKSQLQELIQLKYRLIPNYRLIEASGPDHDRRFTVEVVLGDTVLGRGSGKSKKIAETEAARSALEQLPDDFTR
jgi:ribonuclease-3